MVDLTTVFEQPRLEGSTRYQTHCGFSVTFTEEQTFCVQIESKQMVASQSIHGIGSQSGRCLAGDVDGFSLLIYKGADTRKREVV